MRFRSGSDIGLRREENQDAVRCEYFGHNVLAVVCDGMGGLESGARASLTAVSMMKLGVRKLPTKQLNLYELQRHIRQSRI